MSRTNIAGTEEEQKEAVLEDKFFFGFWIVLGTLHIFNVFGSTETLTIRIMETPLFGLLGLIFLIVWVALGQLLSYGSTSK